MILAGRAFAAFPEASLRHWRRHMDDGRGVHTAAREASDNDHEIRGVAGSPDRYTGRVMVVREESQFEQLRPGDILVCPDGSGVVDSVHQSRCARHRRRRSALTRRHHRP